MAFIHSLKSVILQDFVTQECWSVLNISKRFISVEMKEKLAAERKRLKDEFEVKEQKWDLLVNFSLLNSEDILIYNEHKAAVHKGRFTYDDPETGYRVMTRLRHFYRGSCCGNACRHCVYDHANVAEHDKARRIFNSAFWVDKESRSDLVKQLGLKASLALSREEDIKKYFRNEEVDETDKTTDPLLFKH